MRRSLSQHTIRQDNILERDLGPFKRCIVLAEVSSSVCDVCRERERENTQLSRAKNTFDRVAGLARKCLAGPTMLPPASAGVTTTCALGPGTPSARLDKSEPLGRLSSDTSVFAECSAERTRVRLVHRGAEEDSDFSVFCVWCCLVMIAMFI